MDERPGLFLLSGQQMLLAGAGVNHDAQGQPAVCLARKITNLLGDAILGNFEIFLIEIRDQTAFLVLDGRVDVDYHGRNLQGRFRLRIDLLFLSWRLRRRGNCEAEA